MYLQVFLIPIRKEQIIEEKFASAIFCNIEMILAINEQFLSALTERIEVQQSQNISDLFQKLVILVVVLLFVQLLYFLLLVVVLFVYDNCCNVLNFLYRP
jgi:hypothetical protein